MVAKYSRTLENSMNWLKQCNESFIRYGRLGETFERKGKQKW